MSPRFVLLLGLLFLASPAFAADVDWEPIDVEAQPFVAAAERLAQAMQIVGSPLAQEEIELITAAKNAGDDAKASRQAVQKLQAALDKHCLAVVRINPESRVSAAEGPAKKELIEQGWRTYLIKVHNEARITPVLRIESPNALPVYERGKGAREEPLKKDKLVQPADVPQRFLDLDVFGKQPLKPQLSGLECEYRIVQLYSRDAGDREATLAFHVGQGTQDLGFRSDLPLLFRCQPSCELRFSVLDDDGTPTMAAFTIRDSQRRVYPNPARRLAPDFFFHEQIYRADGETVRLPAGEYEISCTRGPEYFVSTRMITISAAEKTHAESFRLKRWVHPKARGWYSGDHHVHAAGCAHYDSPTEGVGPADMLRHILGEDLNVGCVLSWGPCWYTQKKFFEGKTNALSQPNYLMRYDIEVSGFPSSHAGHLCLLRLKEDDYPGTDRLEDWPSWTQPVLAWGKEQGGVVGYSHSGWGLELPDVFPAGERKFRTQQRGDIANPWLGRAADKLPDYAMPRFDGIGANEYVVTAANGQCDFLSAVDTPAVWELNVWYHTLNCGLRPRISGETDFPCIYGERVGLGRIYVKLPTDKPLDFDAWCAGLKDGRSYCNDGMSHLFDFKVNDVRVGEPGSEGKISQLNFEKSGIANITCEVAALLAEKPTPETERIRGARLDEKPYWHVERARLGETRRVPVELIVNGRPIAKKEIVADGSTQPLSFSVSLDRSSWIALRIFPSCHTNPVFVEVGGKPIRADKKSAEWCRDAVEVCWKSKQNQIRPPEREAARAAYDQAKKYYEQVVVETNDN